MFHQPVHGKRYFQQGKKYNEINWNDFRAVVEAFTSKIEGWYLDKVEQRHSEPRSPWLSW